MEARFVPSNNTRVFFSKCKNPNSFSSHKQVRQRNDGHKTLHVSTNVALFHLIFLAKAQEPDFRSFTLLRNVCWIYAWHVFYKQALHPVPADEDGTLPLSMNISILLRKKQLLSLSEAVPKQFCCYDGVFPEGSYKVFAICSTFCDLSI